MPRPPVAHLVTAALVLTVGCGDKKQDGPAADPTTGTTDPKAAELKYGLTPEQAEKVLVKVGDTTITVGQFAERLGSQSPYLRARYNSPERRREFLDNMVRFELLAKEAIKRGHDKEPDVQRVRRQMMVQQMMKELFDQKGVKLSDIKEEEIKAYYDAHQEDFAKPAQVRASHILVKNKAMAQRIHDQLAADQSNMQLFRKLAKQHNTDAETKDRFGDLRFFSEKPEEGAAEPEVPEPVRAAAFQIEKTGDMPPGPIESELGFHVLKVTGKRAALNRSLEDARRLIQNRLWREKREKAIETFVAELRKKAEVKENLALLPQVRIDPRPGPKDED